MFREPKAMREIHKIQEQLYKGRKGLSSAEIIERTREAARKLKEKYGLKSKKNILA
jgi:hypothetical protein